MNFILRYNVISATEKRKGRARYGRLGRVHGCGFGDVSMIRWSGESSLSKGGLVSDLEDGRKVDF